MSEILLQGITYIGQEFIGNTRMRSNVAFFFNDTATTEIYTLSLHDALPILEINMTIAGGADVILLDEPTAGMSRSETEHVIALIRQVTAGKTLLMVEHDMSVVFDLADRIAVLVYGEVIAHDTPERIRANAAVQEAYLGTPQSVA